ncbi:MAG TPA: prephenate dehydrogenase [Marmoricola sp.]|nr:prephenate dehydrogenase [Marmoricola sp.]
MLGTSIGLALRRHGIEVWLSDTENDHVRTAAGLGAGVPAPAAGRAQLVVVAVPPALTAAVVQQALASGAPVTDVASVKAGPLQALTGPVQRYVGSHPMAGSERSGPLAASAALFDGRPWAITPHSTSQSEVVELVTTLARACGAVPVPMTPDDHDLAVARTSHLPHLMATLVAAQLADADPSHLALSGQGVRDVTRIAAGEPALWQQIVAANAPALRDLLSALRQDLDRLIVALDHPAELTALLDDGVRGTRAIPGKHGGPALVTASVYVAVSDQPGELARLLADVGDSGANLEDLHIDHDPGRPRGLVEIVVAEAAADRLRRCLESKNWTVHR